MSENPLVSVIVPTLNVAGKVAASLRSILDDQAPFTDVEVLLIDGVSTDATLDIARQWAARDARVQIWSEPDGGLFDAMNKGIARARGQMLYFLGAGDTVRPQVFAALRELPALHPHLLLHGQVWNPRSNVEPGAGAGIKPFDLARYNIPHQGAFYGRDVFDIVGLYDQKYLVCADYELNWRCWTNPRIETRFWDRIVADFELGGLSSGGQDAAFRRDWPGHVWRRGGPLCWASYQVSRYVSPRQLDWLRKARARLRATTASLKPAEKP